MAGRKRNPTINHPGQKVRHVYMEPPHSPMQREMIEWPGSGVAFAGRRYGKCIAEGQLVWMADGTRKPVEDVVPGDMVLSVGPGYALQAKPVQHVHDNGIKPTVSVETSDQTLVCTPNHPILTLSEWVEAGRLKQGKSIAVLGDGKVLWRSVQDVSTQPEQQTYDLTVADNHNFICEGIVVHNTTVGRQRILRFISQQPGLYWWVGLSWKSASMKRAWREIRDFSSQAIRAAGMDPDKMINLSNYEIRLPNGGEIWMRTAERPESLAGEGIRGAVVDEFTLMPEVIWTEYLQGTLLDYSGWAFFIGVPKGENWGASLWRRAKDIPGWKQWHATSYDNPFINPEDLDLVRDTTPDTIFRQEYLAEIVDSTGSVFRNVIEAATATPQDGPREGHTYVMGVDLAALHDFTVITIIDVTLGEVVQMQRFNKVSLTFQEARIYEAWERFRPIVSVVEETGIGFQMSEGLEARGVPVTRFKTTNQSKDVNIQGLVSSVENQRLKLLPQSHEIGKLAIQELVAYTMKQSTSGNWIYGAPHNEHDDCVMSIMLAHSALNQRISAAPLVAIG